MMERQRVYPGSPQNGGLRPILGYTNIFHYASVEYYKVLLLQVFFRTSPEYYTGLLLQPFQDCSVLQNSLHSKSDGRSNLSSMFKILREWIFTLRVSLFL